MMVRRFRGDVLVFGVACALAAAGCSTASPEPMAREGAGAVGVQPSDWHTYGGDLANTRYRPFDQIDASNFDTLDVAWRFRTESLGPRPEFNFQSTPLMVDGVLYTTGGARRAVVALDAATGEMLWMHREDEGERGRGVAAPHLGPGPRVLVGRHRGAHPLRDHRVSARGARREDRHPHTRIRS
jgi:glucose dehydrogenase